VIPDDRPGEVGAANQTAIERFRKSMHVTYEMWHDGIGYNLDALEEATADERAAIEAQLLGRGISGWRDVEALVALGTDRALDVVRSAGVGASTEIRLAVARIAPDLVSEQERGETIVHALETATLGDGLSGAIDQAAEFHPAAVIDALLRGARSREGQAAVHFAALLLFIHGITDEPFAWSERPFFLRFHSTGEERRLVFRELCDKIGIDPASFETGQQRVR
jgi:hypothetical protein